MFLINSELVFGTDVCEDLYLLVCDIHHARCIKFLVMCMQFAGVEEENSAYNHFSLGRVGDFCLHMLDPTELLEQQVKVSATMPSQPSFQGIHHGWQWHMNKGSAFFFFVRDITWDSSQARALKLVHPKGLWSQALPRRSVKQCVLCVLGHHAWHTYWHTHSQSFFPHPFLKAI